MEYLNTLPEKYPDHTQLITKIINLFNSKYWHQFGQAVREFSKIPEISNSDEIKSMFEMIFQNIQINIDPTIFIELTCLACHRINGIEDQTNFLDQVDERVKEKHAKVMLLTVRAIMQILNSDFEKANEHLKEAEPVLKAMYNVSKVVYSFFFKAKALYHLKRNEYSEFYQNSLQYLAYTDPEDLSDQEKLDISSNMAVAILVSEKIFNFSELLELDVFHSLKDSPNSYLVTLMETYNQGDVEEFYKNVKEFQTQLEANTTLKSHSKTLEDKIKITAFTELIFSLPKNNRQVSFERILETTTIPEDMIELMILKAMSLDLIRGGIDEVNKNVDITWIQPRVLDTARISQMKEKFVDWQGTLEGLLQFVVNFQQTL